jgi:hypothetical protein
VLPALCWLSPERRSAARIVQSLRRHRIAAQVIGEICTAKNGITMVENGRARPIRVPARDEIAHLLESAAGLESLQPNRRHFTRHLAFLVQLSPSQLHISRLKRYRGSAASR